VIRFIKFQGVGALGIVVQLGVLTLLKRTTGLSTSWATALAVESAILHNFVWHERWTWKSETGARTPRQIASLLGKFHLGAGGVSLLTNVALTATLADLFHIHYLVANLISIAAAGLLNYFINDRLVFGPGLPASPAAPVPGGSLPASARRSPPRT